MPTQTKRTSVPQLNLYAYNGVYTGRSSSVPIPLLQGPRPVQQQQQQKGRPGVGRLLRSITARLAELKIKNPPLYHTAADGEPPAWVARRADNARNCRFYGLPEELLLAVLEHTDLLSRQMLRQTCSLFVRIVADLDRRRDPVTLHADSMSVFKQWGPVWPCHGTNVARIAIAKQWAALAARDVCASCRAVQREDPAQFAQALLALRRPLWCGGCHRTHPRAWFSASQRDTAPEPVPGEERVCIGRQGGVRACTHRDVTWDAFQSAIKIARESGLRYEREHYFEDCDGSVLESCDVRVVEWMDECRDLSHWPRDRPRVRKLLRLRCPCASPGAAPQVTFKTADKLLPNVHPARVTIRWKSPLFDLDDSRPVARQHLWSLLARWAAAAGGGESGRGAHAPEAAAAATALGHALCPHVLPGDGQLLLPFESGACACFPDDGNSSSAHGGRCHTHQDAAAGRAACCRCRGKCWRTEPDRGTAFLPEANRSTRGGAWLHSYQCPHCLALYQWRRGRGGRVYLTVRRVVEAKGPAGLAWIKQLDPASWGLLDDEETRGILWCPDTSCATRARWSNLYRQLERLDRWYQEPL